jgi:hypothetical protein
MEISKTIIDQSLSRLSNVKSDPELNKILRNLAKLAPSKFINTKTRRLKNSYHRLHGISSDFYHKSEVEQIELLATYYKTSLKLFYEGFKKGSLSKLFSVIVIYGYFPLPYKEMLKKLKITKFEEDVITERIIKVFKSLKIKLSIPKGGPYHENEMLLRAKESVRKNELDGFYATIRAMENSGRGLHWSFFLENVGIFLLYLNKSKLIRYLQSCKDPFPIVYYLQEFKMEEIVALANCKNKNKWLCFELIRLLNNHYKGGYTIKAQIAAGKQLAALYSLSEDFFKQAMSYFESSELVMAAFGSICKNLPESFLNEVFENFKLDRYSNRLDAHWALLVAMENAVDQAKLKRILSDIYDIWLPYINSLFNNDDYFQFNPLLTDYANYVVAHYALNESDAIIIQRMNDLMNNIAYLDSEWCVSRSKQITKYHWYSSMLYILSMAYKEKKLSDVTIESKIAALAINTLQISKYSTRTERLALQMAYDIIHPQGCVT